jgi:hypothetical protein
MTERLLRDVVDVESDIPPGMTIRDWRRQRTGAPARPARGLASTARRAVVGSGRAVARAFARPRVARVRARGSRHAAARCGGLDTQRCAVSVAACT